MKIRLAVAFVVAMSGATAFAGGSPTPPDPAGVVKNPTGNVTIVRGGQTIKAREGTVVFEGDLVQTGFSGRAGLIMQDDTIISLGRRSRIFLDRYVYKPDENKLSLLLNLLRGKMLYISGKIERLAPDRVQIQTPDAVVGVRGTQVLVEVQ